MRKLTVREIAKLAGVSPSTVTRALQDHPRIAETTKAKIRAIVRRNEQKPIGMLIANPLGDLASDTFFAEVIKGAAEFLKGSGRQLLLESFDGQANSPLPDMITQERVCGIIVGGIPIDDEVVRRLANTLPAVFIGATWMTTRASVPSFLTTSLAAKPPGSTSSLAAMNTSFFWEAT